MSDVELRHDKMVGLVETLVKLHRDLPKAKTPHEREILKRQVAATDRQRDALVYGLYGLTETKSASSGQERGDSRHNMGSVPDYPRLFTPRRP